MMKQVDLVQHGRCTPSPRLRGEGWVSGCFHKHRLWCPPNPKFAARISTSPRKRDEVDRAIRQPPATLHGVVSIFLSGASPRPADSRSTGVRERIRIPADVSDERNASVRSGKVSVR